MNDIHSIRFEPLTESNFVKPLRMRYVQNGTQKLWDFNKIHDSVAILIYNVTRKVFILVRQFRPAVYYSSIPTRDGLFVDTHNTEIFPPIEQGFTLELCAGVVDKNLSIEEIAKEEVLEECGYDVPVSSFKKIMTYREGIGITGDKQTLFYVEVSDDMKVSEGGGNPKEGEMIDVIEMTVEDAKKYMGSGDVMSPGGFLFALMWFFQYKYVCTSSDLKQHTN